MTDIKRTLSDYLYAFKASGNPNRWDPSNVAFYYDLREQLEGDNDYQDEPTVDRFVYCSEKTATQWERDEFRVAERSKKRTHTSSSSSVPDRSSHSSGYDKGKSSKKTESSSSRYGPSDPRPNARDATRDNTRDNRSSTVRFDPKDTKGIQPTMTSLAHISCDCNAQDIDTTYRMCCVTVGNSPSYSAATLFDTGAHTSFVNREVAAWIVQQFMTCDGVTQGKRKAHSDIFATSVRHLPAKV